MDVIFSGFFEPLFYLLGIGFGLGALIGDVPGPGGQEIRYQLFVAPALLATASMNGAIMESTFNVFFKLNYQKTYDAILSTPMSVGDVALGEIGWALIRGGLYAIGFLVVMAVFGLWVSPWLILAFPAALLVGFAFAAVGMAATSFMRTWQDFDLIQLVILPLFLFSATFYPLETYPEALQGRPDHAAVPGRRPDPLAGRRGDLAGPARPRRVPDGHGPDRSGHHVAAARQAPAEVAWRDGSGGPRGLDRRDRRLSRCPRLVEWREQVAREKVARFRDETYWARPVPGFGDPDARILLLGLAPAAHGGNRTGRVFTGDASGDFLFAALYAVGFADRPVSRRADDGLTLFDTYIAAAVRCAPPANKPTIEERDTCAPWLALELGLLARVRVIVALGSYAWDAGLRLLAAEGHVVRPKPRFGHGAEAAVGPYRLLGTYHPSQQNTFTGVLTPPMLEAVLRRARELADELPA